MSLKTIGAKITGTFARQTLTVKEHSPVLLAGLGIAGVVATAVLAGRATLKASAVLQEAEENLKSVEQDDKNPVDVEKSVFSTQVKTAIEIAKIYAPTVIMGTVTVLSFMGSVKILRARNAAISAAFAATNTAFNNYRERVVADQGEGKDREYMYGGTEMEIVEEGPNGPETRTVTAVDAQDIKDGKIGSPYAKVFDETNINFSRIPGRNSDFIQGQMLWANDLLNSKGIVFLNDVYELLGFERTEAGQRVGWVKGSQEGDSYITFGLWESGVFQGKEWLLRHDHQSVVLDFNVDGEVAQLLKKF
ncbi:hypothetical protein SEA_LIBERTYBELL_47 [Streptomyces phage LibertyBell]|nr:hypothetical protein SEA_LIBERTYBELL_47 [Streptomyces phage LibertyBell]